MLLVITSTEDVTADSVLTRVDQPHLSVHFDAQEQSSLNYYVGGGLFNFSLGSIDISEVTHVWYRVGLHGKIEFKTGDAYGLMNRLCRESLVSQIYGLLSKAKWVSDPYAVERAENKALQLKLANSLGFNVPRTLITGSPNLVEEFRRSLKGDHMVIKPIRRAPIVDEGEDVAIYTVRIAPRDEIDLSLLPLSPAIFQESIDGECNIRVIIANQQVFSVSISSNLEEEVDWRKVSDDLMIAPYELPKLLSEKCLQLANNLGLGYSAMDLILGKDGEFYFIENNPNGAWTYFANEAGLPIAEALAASLCS